MSDLSEKNGIWFVYDGECPLCKSAALALRIKQQYGTLHLINARETYEPDLIKKINEGGFDLDEGMLIYTGNRFYHGKDALRFMARYSDTQGLFSIVNKILCSSNTLAMLIYPWMRGIRNLLLRRQKIERIDNLNLKDEPIFKRIFGQAWGQLPAVLRKHYCNRPYTHDGITVEGSLDVMCAGSIKWLAPLLWLMGSIPPHNETHVPVSVRFESDKNTQAFHFKRSFHFKTRKTYRFQSRMLQIKDNEVIEIMRFRIGWRMLYVWEDERVKLKHKGYILNIFGHFIPLPITFLIGEGYAEELAIDENTFAMFVHITHPWWGKIYEYKGSFSVQPPT